ncbi:hypothetical protein [Geosporobacter ferrireducens]|uniref:hypothetical protein n=1 Tax=Geosporobacter ferrireducens TaxID=1424294 RepID=UPI0012EA36C5|nr:hypothetical protein [Geosporobacter ferrireducens]
MQIQNKSVLALMTTLIIIAVAVWVFINYKSNTQKFTRAKLVYEAVQEQGLQRM